MEIDLASYVLACLSSLFVGWKLRDWVGFERELKRRQPCSRGGYGCDSSQRGAVVVNTLHEQLLELIGDPDDSPGYRAFMVALRAVVELHAPDAFGDCSAPCFDSSENQQRHPCETIEVVASALGVETAE